MQPYFFPYLGHFALIANVDRWVVLDVTQYTPKSWMNRNRILHPRQGWMYVSVPVQSSSQHLKILDVRLDRPERSLRSILGKLDHYRRRAPHHGEVASLVEQAFADRSDDSLVALDVAGLQVTCEYLGLPFHWSLCSQMHLDLSAVQHPGQWALRIAEQLGASEYLNPIGGASLFCREEFEEAGVQLSFLDVGPVRYDTGPFAFEPSLSILDVLMWNEPREVRSLLRAAAVVGEGTASG